MSQEKKLNSGYAREVAELKENGQMKLKEGKSPLTYNAYRLMAKATLSSSSDFLANLFSHLFLVLSWNVGARSITVASLMLAHFNWVQDALVITIGKHKGIETLE
jgi:hypothetical protein